MSEEQGQADAGMARQGRADLHQGSHEEGVEGTDAQVAVPGGCIGGVEIIRHSRYSSALHPAAQPASSASSCFFLCPISLTAKSVVTVYTTADFQCNKCEPCDLTRVPTVPHSPSESGAVLAALKQTPASSGA